MTFDIQLNIFSYALSYYLTRDSVAAAQKQYQAHTDAANALLDPHMQYAMLAGTLLVGILIDKISGRGSMIVSQLASIGIYGASLLVLLPAGQQAPIPQYALLAAKALTTLQHSMFVGLSIVAIRCATFSTNPAHKISNGVKQMAGVSAAYGLGTVIAQQAPKHVVQFLPPGQDINVAYLSTAVALTFIAMMTLDKHTSVVPAAAKKVNVKNGKKVAQDVTVAAAPKGSYLAVLFALNVWIIVFCIRFGRSAFATNTKVYNALELLPKEFRTDYAISLPANIIVIPILCGLFKKGSMVAVITLLLAVIVQVCSLCPIPLEKDAAAPFIGIAATVIGAALYTIPNAIVATAVPTNVAGFACAIGAAIGSLSYKYTDKVTDAITKQLVDLKIPELCKDNKSCNAVGVAGLFIVAIFLTLVTIRTHRK